MGVQVTKIGDIVPAAFTDIIMLQAFIGTDGNVSHLRLPFSTSGYQVTAGKSLYMAKVQERGSSTGTAYWKFGYCDNDVGFNTATARTNAVMSMGVDDTGSNGWNTISVTSSSLAYALPNEFLWKIAIASKFPFVRRVGAAPAQGLFLWCFEL
jgi:hypothetical protein